MRTFRQRVWVSTLVVACGLAAGGFAGYVLGRALTLKQSEGRLEQYASRVIDEGEKSTVESRKVLASMDASPYGKCSDAEIRYFSNLIYASQYLKAAGRMRDGRIECATPFGRAVESTIQYKADIRQRDGTFLYRNLAPFQVGKELVIAIQKGDSFIVYSPYNLKPVLNDAIELTITDVDSPNYPRLGAAPAGAARAFLVKNGQFSDKTFVYGTRCTPDGVVCVA